MKLVADENLDRSVIQKLTEAGHEVISVAEMEPGISDEVVLSAANSHEAMLAT
jgi:predicted nuclease of predicted toxin-antitoxin system